MQAIQGNKDAISSLSNTLSCDINAVQTALNTINTSVSQIACDTNSGKALLNGSGDQMPTEEISTGNKYLIYYDKRTGVFQTVNHIVAPAAA